MCSGLVQKVHYPSSKPVKTFTVNRQYISKTVCSQTDCYLKKLDELFSKQYTGKHLLTPALTVPWLFSPTLNSAAQKNSQTVIKENHVKSLT